jgi:hypothetical protein
MHLATVISNSDAQNTEHRYIHVGQQIVHREPQHVVYIFRIFSEPCFGLYKCMYAQYSVRNTIIDSCGPGEFSRYSDWLRVGRSGDQISVGARFSATVQAGPGWLTRPGRGVDHPPPYSAEFKERVELYIYSPSGRFWPVLRRTLLYFTLL